MKANVSKAPDEMSPDSRTDHRIKPFRSSVFGFAFLAMSASSVFQIIAVDGGAATGKSSTSRAVAEQLDLMHVDTGAHYRTLTAALLDVGADPAPETALTAILQKLELDTRLEGRSAWLAVNGEVPETDRLRSPQVNAAVSSFAALVPVREALFHYQRAQADIARRSGFAGLIMEGRDIGSVIFPDADHRFFLYADEATRTERRAREGQEDSISDRDKLDSARKTAPLHCPEGAVQVDTSSRGLDAVVDHIIQKITR